MKRKYAVRNFILCLLAAAVIIPLYAVTAGHIKSQPKLQYTYGTMTPQSMASYPDTRFAVISDLHYYDNSLGTSGPAFEACLNSDRKMLKDSADLLNFAIDHILKSGVKFVLIPGDLTKDGEMLCHQRTAAALSRLTRSGVKVYVVPGNHDINNPGAFKYEGDKSIPIPSISADQFGEIYNDYGYGSAIYRDSSSLSYVAEPENNLWLIALDSCRYRENKPGGEETVGGKLSQSQEKWLEDMLKKAGQNGKAVMVMEHHGVVEHWTGQSRLHPDYLIQDYRYIGRLLASYGVRLAFTGHYHAQDITRADFNSSGFLYDVETGSVITSPCPVRYCTISNNKIKITSKNLAEKLHPGTDFAKNAEQFVYNTAEREAYNTLRKYLVSEKDAHSIAGYVAAGFTAHYKGDEKADDRPAFDGNKLGLWSRIVYLRQKYAADGLWKDLPPADNNVVLDLAKRNP
ncbi:MAG: metallophosphoesterase [Clostridiales bacterium]|jgi:3',5'-cyclic AMP phosphodiesterase CpdA|nr:metallophosphoesterase [Eubacteriales bacterium]MDH7566006.1 metallophosphoesterase [Clostridiales bacterium]